MVSPELLKTEDRGVFIEKAHLGDTQLIAALCEHLPENMPAVARELRDCSVIAMEAVGIENQDARNEKSDMYTRILDSQLDNQEELRMGMAPLRTEAVSALVYEFIGSGKQLVFIDINKDHPEFPTVQESTLKRKQYADTISDIAPVAASSNLLLEAAQATAVAYDIRDDILANDIKELAKKMPDHKIGVVLGANHAGAIDAVAKPDSPEATRMNRQKIAQDELAFDKIVRKFRTGQDIDQSLLHRGLMESYFMAAQVPKDERYDTLAKMDDDMILRVLKSIDTTATSNQAIANKRQIVFDQVKAVAEIARDL